MLMKLESLIVSGFLFKNAQIETLCIPLNLNPIFLHPGTNKVHYAALRINQSI